MPTALIEIDPFDLPEWLGTEEVVWAADEGVRGRHLVAGRLTGPGRDDVVCDLLAVDQAYPQAVTAPESRLRAHQAWHHGQVLVADYAGRLTLAVPGTAWTPEAILDALSRLAKSVGARPERYAALMRLGD